MRELQLALPRFKITKLCFGILDRVTTSECKEVVRSVTLEPIGRAEWL